MATPYKGVISLECISDNPCKENVDADCVNCVESRGRIVDLEGKVIALIPEYCPPGKGPDIDTKTDAKEE